ncbi:hypothetical protein FRC14_000222 [Serendipita sp. 396]|nr:hypothetical protein FRC14_000222 [Serendipita sp. 396]KAG8863017.1 hypothetical protein FRC20_010950 [Serendipita sp. 405]
MFLNSLASGLPTLTIVEIVQRVLCQLWYIRNRPDKIPESGDIPDEMCQTPGPVAAFSAFMVIQAILISAAGFMITSFIGQYAALMGRKPILLLVLLGGLATACSFSAALFIPSYIGVLVFFSLWLILSALSYPVSTLMIINLMVIDTALPDERTTRLALIFGGMYAGEIPAYTIGGFINRVVGPRILSLIIISISLFQVLYASAITNETFGGEKREAARQERHERRQTARERSLERWAEQEGDSTRGLKRAVRKTYEAIRAVLDPLTRLQPVKRDDGRWNYRLTMIGISYFLMSLSSGYVNVGLIAYLTIVLRRNPEQNGFILTWISAMQLTGATIAFPLISKLGRILYAKLTARKQKGKGPTAGQDPDISRAERDVSPAPSSDTISNPRSEYSSAHFDVYLLRWSWSFIALFFVVIGFAKNTWQLAAVCSLVLAFSGAHPTIQAITAASVNSIQTGEAIAGLEMVGAIGRFASPLVFGAVQAKVIITAPLVLWMSMAAVTIAGIALTFFIRDDDRYIPTAADLVSNGNGEDRSH